MACYKTTMRTRRLLRQDLGAKFSEGSRLFWSVVTTHGRGIVAARLGCGSDSLSRLLYGDRRPGHFLALRIQTEFSIDRDLWWLPPLEAFVPPAARAA